MRFEYLFFSRLKFVVVACLLVHIHTKTKTQQSEEAVLNRQTWQSLAENISITHQLKKHCTRNKILAENPQLAENPHGAEYKSLKKRCAEEQLSVVGCLKSQIFLTYQPITCHRMDDSRILLFQKVLIIILSWIPVFENVQ